MCRVKCENYYTGRNTTMALQDSWFLRFRPLCPHGNTLPSKCSINGFILECKSGQFHDAELSFNTVSSVRSSTYLLCSILYLYACSLNGYWVHCLHTVTHTAYSLNFTQSGLVFMIDSYKYKIEPCSFNHLETTSDENYAFPIRYISCLCHNIFTKEL